MFRRYRYRDAYEESMSDLLDFEQYKLDWASTSAIDKYYPPEMRRVPIILERKQRVNKIKRPSKSKKIASNR